MIVILPIGYGVFAGLVAFSEWVNHNLRWEPDFSLYTQGGLGLYPSPIGRLLGSFGITTFAIFSIIGSALVVFLVFRASGTVWSSVAIALSPVVLYLAHVGIDGIALAFYAASLAGIMPARMLTIAALTHFSLVPFVALEVVRSKRLSPLGKVVIAYFVVPCVAMVLAVTPYGGVVSGLFDRDFPLAFVQGLGAGVIVAAPAILLFRLRPSVVVGFVIGAFECGIQGHLQARYLLPAAIFLAATGTRRSWVVSLGLPDVRFLPQPRRGV